MRATPLIVLAATSWGSDAFGVWKLNPGRSTLSASQKTVMVRIEPHSGGEVFTVETVTPDRRASTVSTVLYFDGKTRDFEDSTCSGTQLSRHVDTHTVEILRECAGGAIIRILRKQVNPGLLILDITEHSLSRWVEQSLVFEKH